MERRLELKDIAGYFPYGLHVLSQVDYFGKQKPLQVVAACQSVSKTSIVYANVIGQNILSDYCKPILRPMSDLYRKITHNGKGDEIEPIVELAKISSKDDTFETSLKWEFTDELSAICKEIEKEFYYIESSFVLDSYIDDNIYTVRNQYQCFDYLHELKIDYRGLIDAGLAIDTNTLEINPYK